MTQSDFNKSLKVSYSMTDMRLKLGISAMFNLVQDINTEYFENIGLDNLTLKNKKNSAWVISKTKLVFKKDVNWNEELFLRSYTTLKKKARINIETTVKDKDNDLLFSSMQESCVINLSDRKLRLIDSIDYPEDMIFEESIIENGFERLNEEFKEEDFVYEVVSRAEDIDFTRHVNNEKYVVYILNALDSKFYENFSIKTFEIHYLNEVKENEKLKIYMKREDESIHFLIKKDDVECVRAKIVL